MRLTFNPGTDLAPRWLPQSGEILYSADRRDRVDEDRCLAVLPGGGGAVTRYICRSTGTDDSTHVLDEPALSADGRIAYVRQASHRFPSRPVAPDVEALVVAPLDRPNDAQVLQLLDYQAPSGAIHQGIGYVTFLAPTRLAYVGRRVVYPRACSSCPPDTVSTGIEVVALDFTAAPVLSVVPGTDSASSVAAGATGDTIYFTRNGDTRVYRRAFSSGQLDTVFDFAAAGIARDVEVRNGRLMAVVGGSVSYAISPTLGPIQIDSGGPLALVRLSDSAVATIGDATSRFRRPAFSPAGTRIVAEGRNADGTADLWLLNVP